MRYIMIGVLIGFLASYAIDTFFPSHFQARLSAIAMFMCIILGIIMQYNADKNPTQQNKK